MPSPDAVAEALRRDRTIDITTTGRRSGKPRRIEIWFHHLDGRVVITGLPGRRDWYANLLAHPDFTFHLKETVRADLPARARPVTDPGERRAILVPALSGMGRDGELERWLADAPLVEVTFV